MRLDHAAVGNGRVLALVSPAGSVDWLCLPRFDSASIFARLLDEERGGAFGVVADSGPLRGALSYVPNTNVARTVFTQDDSSWEILDYAPRIPEGLTVRCPLELVRLIRPLSGRPLLRVVFEPRPEYGLLTPELREVGRGVEVGATKLSLVSNLPAAYILGQRPFALDQPVYLALRYASHEPAPSVARVQHDLELTVAGWRAWARTCALPVFRPELVLRSALCLKLHAFEDTGAIIAAATTSIPEALGTARTWDYRYCWLRDAAFVIESLQRLSHLNEGERFMRYLRDVAESGPLQPVYGIDGERDLEEKMLPHLAGFRGNGHVRIGNAAYSQRQHDLMGEMMLCLDALLSDPRLVHDEPRSYLPLVCRLVDEAIRLAPQPDMGIWEFRTMLRPYTFSRAMCWVAMARGARLARRLGEPDLAEKWERHADAEREEVLRRAWNEERRCFTQALDGQYPDAANLLLPTIGLMPAGDPRFLATLDTYRDHLVQHGLMLRYHNLDDLGRTTSAFSICTFWWAAALAQAGRLGEAIDVFDRMAAHANDVGLFSEDVDPETGDLLGNFPQAYTHVGLVHAATTIGSLIEARDGHMLAWTAG